MDQRGTESMFQRLGAMAGAAEGELPKWRSGPVGSENFLNVGLILTASELRGYQFSRKLRKGRKLSLGHLLLGKIIELKSVRLSLSRGSYG